MKYPKLENFYDNKRTLSKINIKYLFMNFGKLTHLSHSEIEKRSPTTCIHCNDMYFDLWNSMKSKSEKSEVYLNKIFENKCDNCIDAEKMRLIFPTVDTDKPEINVERLERYCPPGWSHLWS
jgi:hypothetical protein